MNSFLQRCVLGMDARAVVQLLLVAVGLMSFASTMAATKNDKPAADRKKPYRFGVVPQFGQRKLFKVWIPVLKRIEKETGIRFELTGSEQIPVFEKRFEAGEFDFAYMNPYHIIRANNKQGYVPLVRDGSRKLQGIIVVRKDSAIKTISDLDGKLVAYPSATALGASLLPRAELDRKYKIKTNPKYVKTHTSVYLHVVQKLVIAGGGVKSTLDHQKPKIRNLLRVLYTTVVLNPHPIVAHPRVPKEDMLAVQNALIKISKDPQGRKLLEKIPMQHVIKAGLSDYKAVQKLRLDRFK